MFNRDLARPIRICLGFCVVGVLYVSFFIAGSWASGWLPALVGLAVIICASRLKASVLPILTVAFLVFAYWERIWNWVMLNDGYSWVTRTAAWGILLEMSWVSPFFGLGPANYHFYTKLYPILGWNVSFNSHNNYVDILVQTGFLGLACFVWFAVEIGLLGWRMRKRVPAGFERAYVYGALGGLAGTLAAGMLGDWVLPFLYNIGLEGFRASALGWVFLGGLLALERINRRAGEVAV
jgi:O-antigen ligase